MKNFVLFSPLGMTDPYRDCYEGAMLHIIRYYNPSKVYLFYTKEVAQYAKVDDRHKRAIRQQHANLWPDEAMPEVAEFIFSDLENPSDFDSINIPYKRCLDKIIDENPESEILMNISSGTPQMQSTACLIGVTRYKNRSFRLVKVNNPEGKSGRSQEHMQEYKDEDIATLFDNEPDAKNRCSEPNVRFFGESMRREQFVKLIRRYDYAGAAELMNLYSDEYNDSVKRVVQHMTKRVTYDYRAADRILKEEDKTSFAYFPVETSDYRKIYEFYMGTYIKYLRKEWNDYLLRLSPLLVNLIEFHLDKKYSFDVRKFCRKGPVAWKLDAAIIQNNDPALFTFLCIKSYSGRFEDTFVSLQNLLWIFEYQQTKTTVEQEEKDILLLFEELRKVESDLRNVVAHQMIIVSNQWAKDVTGKTFEAIQKILMRLLGLVVKNNFGAGWRDFPERINQQIIEILDK